MDDSTQKVERSALKAELMAIFKETICIGWDDNRGCYFNRTCSDCKESKEAEFEKLADVLIAKQLLPASTVLRMVAERIEKLKSDGDHVPVSDVRRIPEDVEEELCNQPDFN